MMDDPIRYKRLNPPERMLLGPDLSNASPRARQGLIAVLEGAGDPSFLKVMEEALTLLRWLWGTENQDTFIIPGSEETALMAGLANLIEPGDAVVVSVAGFFGQRLAETAARLGAKVVPILADPGQAVDPEVIRDALRAQDARLLAVLHGDGSTGVEQPLDGLGKLAREHGALLLVDSRWTTGALDLNIHRLGIDVCVAGSQKAISAYPGLGLVTFSPRAVEARQRRHSPVVDWTLDLDNLRDYAREERAVQTIPAPLVYAFTEMLQLAYEQDMRYRISRHVNRRDALVAGLEALNLELYAKPGYRLPTVTTVMVPAGIDQDRVREQLLNPYRIDIGGGLGELRGQLWRIGIMSHSAQPTYLLSFLTLLEVILEKEGYSIPKRGSAVRALLDNLEP